MAKNLNKTGKSNKAVFLDRDGTINAYLTKVRVHKKKDFKFVPNAFESLKKLSDAGYKLVIVTNQAGVGKGYYTDRDVRSLHKWMLGKFKKKNVKIDKVYYCPHHPDEGCLCRKPNLGMIKAAVAHLNIDLRKSWVVGDNSTDVLMGRKARMKTIMVKNRFLEQKSVKPDFRVRNLKDAVKIVLA